MISKARFLSGLLVLFLLVIEGPNVFVCALAPCPLGSQQKKLQATTAVALTPSQTATCGQDFVISMDRRNREPSVVLLFFDSVSSQAKEAMPAVLEIFLTADSKDFPSQNITVFGFSSKNTSSHDDLENLSWSTFDQVLKPFDPSENWMTTCSDNVIQENNVMNLGKIEIPSSEVVNGLGGMVQQIDVSKAIRQGIHSFALVRMIECDDKTGGKQDVPKGNIILSSLCSNDTDFQGQQYPPAIVFGPSPRPPRCTFKRGYYKIHINSRDPNNYRHLEYFLTHSLKSKDTTIDVTSSWWIHKISKSRKLWKIRSDTFSDMPVTFFGVKRRTKYSYLGGTKRSKPSLGTKNDKMRIIPRELRCAQVDCENVFLVSDKRKKQGKKSYLTINLENRTNKTVSWKYSREVDAWNGVFQLIPA